MPGPAIPLLDPKTITSINRNLASAVARAKTELDLSNAVIGTDPTTGRQFARPSRELLRERRNRATQPCPRCGVLDVLPARKETEPGWTNLTISDPRRVISPVQTFCQHYDMGKANEAGELVEKGTEEILHPLGHLRCLSCRWTDDDELAAAEQVHIEEFQSQHLQFTADGRPTGKMIPKRKALLFGWWSDKVGKNEGETYLRRAADRAAASVRQMVRPDAQMDQDLVRVLLTSDDGCDLVTEKSKNPEWIRLALAAKKRRSDAIRTGIQADVIRLAPEVAEDIARFIESLSHAELCIKWEELTGIPVGQIATRKLADTLRGRMADAIAKGEIELQKALAPVKHVKGKPGKAAPEAEEKE